MIVTIVSATSVDGKLTKHDEYGMDGWLSKEDQVHYRGMIESHDAIIFGRTVYEQSNGRLNLKPGKLRVVLTSKPEKYSTEEVEGQLEFRNESVEDAVKYIESQGKQNLLVAGGERMITEFLQSKLVNEIYLTIEPRIFGTGVKMIGEEALDVSLELLEQTQLNDQGTMLLRYKVL